MGNVLLGAVMIACSEPLIHHLLLMWNHLHAKGRMFWSMKFVLWRPNHKRLNLCCVTGRDPGAESKSPIQEVSPVQHPPQWTTGWNRTPAWRLSTVLFRPLFLKTCDPPDLWDAGIVKGRRGLTPKSLLNSRNTFEAVNLEQWTSSQLHFSGFC